MKKIAYILLGAVLLSVACNRDEDYTAIGYYVWKNESDHTITLSSKRYRPAVGLPIINFDNKTLKPGKSLQEEYKVTGAGLIPPPSKFSNEMIVIYDDTLKMTYQAPPYEMRSPSPEHDKKLDPTIDTNYVEEDVEDGIRYTYTFTNDDYEDVKWLIEQIGR